MAEIFEITDDIRNLARAAISDLILGLKKTCRIVYPPIKVVCQCQTNLASGMPASFGLDGGPQFSSNELCQVCGGAGYRDESVTEEIPCLVNSTPSNYKDLPIPDNLKVPGGVISLKTYLEHLPKLKRMAYMIVHTEIENMVVMKYELLGEALDTNNIAKNCFCNVLLKRII